MKNNFLFIFIYFNYQIYIYLSIVNKKIYENLHNLKLELDSHGRKGKKRKRLLV